MRNALLGISLLAASVPAWSDETSALVDRLNAALKAKDYAAAEADAGELLRLKPNNPRYEFELAVTRAQLGKVDGSLAALDALADMGVLIDLNQAAFAPVKSAPGWPPIAAKFAALRKPEGSMKILIDTVAAHAR